MVLGSKTSLPLLFRCPCLCQGGSRRSGLEERLPWSETTTDTALYKGSPWILLRHSWAALAVQLRSRSSPAAWTGSGITLPHSWWYAQ
jgi:hypothetical protein